MNLETILQTIDQLSPEEQARVREHLAQTAEARIAGLQEAIREFWGDSTEEEMREIFEAMNTKSIPKHDDL